MAGVGVGAVMETLLGSEFGILFFKMPNWCVAPTAAELQIQPAGCRPPTPAQALPPGNSACTAFCGAQLLVACALCSCRSSSAPPPRAALACLFFPGSLIRSAT